MASQQRSLEEVIKVDEHGKLYFTLTFTGGDCPGEVEILNALVTTRPNKWFAGKLDFLAVTNPDFYLPVNFTVRDFSRRDNGIHYVRGKISTSSLDEKESRVPVCRYTAWWTPLELRLEMKVFANQEGHFFDPFFWKL